MDERATIKISRQLKDTLENLDGQFMTDKIYSLLTERKNQEQQPYKPNIDNVDIKPTIDKIHVCINNISIDTERIKQDIDKIKEGLRLNGVKIS